MKPKSKPATPLLSAELRALFRHQALLPNEDPDHCKQLVDQLVAAMAPANVVELMLLEDICHYTTLIDRYRRFSTAIITAGQKDAMADFFGMIADGGKFKVYNRRQTGMADAHGSIVGKPEDRESARLKLQQFGVTFDGVLAGAFSEKQAVIERLDQLEAEAVKRRYACLHEVERYRQTLGDRIRHFIDTAEEN